MPRISVLAFLTLIVALPGLFSQQPPPSMRAEGVPDVPRQLMDRLNQYQNVRSAFVASWHATKREMLIGTRFADTVQAHYVREPGGYRQQLTFFRDRVGPQSMSRLPGKEYFLFSMDEGGSEFFQVYRFDLGSGSYAMLTDGKSRNAVGEFNRKGNQVAFGSTRRNGRDYDIYIMNPEEPAAAKLVYQSQGYWQAAEWSPDDRQLLINHFVSINEAHPYILDLASGQAKALLPASEEKSFASASHWTPDGKGVYFVSDRGGEFVELWRMRLDSGELTPLSRHIPWDVSDVDTSPDGSVLAFVTNEDGISKLHLLDTAGGKELASPALPAGQISGLNFHPKLNEVAFTLGTSQTPGDAYSYDVASKTLTRWTFSEVGGLNTSTFPIPDLVHYPTFDQVGGKPRRIPAFVSKPGGRFQPPYPVLINIHGGPEGQAVPSFPRSGIAYLVNELGIAEIQPNVRGSSGYGKSYLKLDNGFLREDTVKDIGALLDWIAMQPDLDRTRVAVIGGSYGGYMSLATMTHYSDRLKAGVEIVGVSHFRTFLENTQEYRRDLRRVEYGDERDPKMRDFFETIAPLNNAQKIKVPVLVAQGKNDPRVPWTESEQIVKRVRENGGSVWYLLAEDEGHGFAKKQNRDYFDYATILFLEKYLLGR